MSARGHSATITYKRTISINYKDIRHFHAEETVLLKEAICKVRTFFEMEKNAGKIIITIDKPRERTTAHGRRNRGGGQLPPPNILPTQKIQDCKNNDI